MRGPYTAFRSGSGAGTPQPQRHARLSWGSARTCSTAAAWRAASRLPGERWLEAAGAGALPPDLAEEWRPPARAAALAAAWPPRAMSLLQEQDGTASTASQRQDKRTSKPGCREAGADAAQGHALRKQGADEALGQVELA